MILVMDLEGSQKHNICSVFSEADTVSSRGSKEQVTVADCEVPPCFILSGRAC